MSKQIIQTQQEVRDVLKPFNLIPVTLDLPFRLNHVNCFLAEGENGWTVIDAGLHNQETKARWDEELKQKTVTDIIITHYHPDHFGYAGGLQEKTGAIVSMTKIDYDAGINAWTESFLSQLDGNYKLAGVPDDVAANMTENTEEFVDRVTPYPDVDHYLEEGERLQIGGNEYEVIFTPGHSDGLVSFYNQDKNILLSTDHILPKITPNISYWFHGDANPLASYLNSLEKVKKLNADLVVPSHGKPFYGANQRINEIEQHHEERLTAALDAIVDGASVYDACHKLFQKRLNVHEMRFAVGETLAHLEYLRHKGECKREMRNGSYWYSV
ncbi:MBL fold metallo-hydrolase [Lentibacillus sp. N15]|uniref:MBL fold metallo-hydrolase n=1 Tax=Lentibacillus songyuanensis TaxID=3136161 RepID=UPI0031BA8B01